jgi:hypothetical protein
MSLFVRYLESPQDTNLKAFLISSLLLADETPTSKIVFAIMLSML